MTTKLQLEEVRTDLVRASRRLFCAGTWAVCLAALLPAFAAPVARASTINYGDFLGTNVAFLNVTEASPTDPGPLFGPPSVAAGNTLLFTPVGFNSSSADPAGSSDITDAQLQVTIAATGGAPIDRIAIKESGDYTIVGPPGAFALAQVSAPVFYWVTEIDGAPTAGPSGTAGIAFGPSGGDFDLADDGPAVGARWSGSVLVDIAGLLDAENLSGDATKVVLTFDNVLATAGAGGGSASIAKKGSQITIGVPEPSTFALAALGLLGLLAFGRTRRHGR